MRHLLDDVHQLRRVLCVDLLRAGRARTSLSPPKYDPTERSTASTSAPPVPPRRPAIAGRVADEKPSSPSTATTTTSRNELRRFAACWAEKVGCGHGRLARVRGQLTLRSTFGTLAASGSASKNSRFVNPNMPAIRTFGKTRIALL